MKSIKEHILVISKIISNFLFLSFHLVVVEHHGSSVTSMSMGGLGADYEVHFYIILIYFIFISLQSFHVKDKNTSYSQPPTSHGHESHRTPWCSFTTKWKEESKNWIFFLTQPRFFYLFHSFFIHQVYDILNIR